MNVEHACLMRPFFTPEFILQPDGAICGEMRLVDLQIMTSKNTMTEGEVDNSEIIENEVDENEVTRSEGDETSAKCEPSKSAPMHGIDLSELMGETPKFDIVMPKIDSMPVYGIDGGKIDGRVIDRKALREAMQEHVNGLAKWKMKH